VARAVIEAFDGWSARIVLTVSAGFYVRSFAHTLGQSLGTGAYLEALQRPRSGEFRLDEAMTVDELCGDPESPRARDGSRAAILDWLIPMERLLTAFPAVTVTDEGRVWIGHGRELGPSQCDSSGAASPTSPGPHQWTRLLDAEGRLLAIATAGKEPGSLHPSVVLNNN
jgi:tRNA pseudouridine55 synthase